MTTAHRATTLVWTAIVTICPWAVAQMPADTAPDSQLVARDPASGRWMVHGAAVRRLFGDDPRLALTLVPGVTVRRSDVGLAGSADLSIRGSAFGETSVYLDGAPINSWLTGRQGVWLGPTSIETAAATTGAPNLTLGGVRGGLIEFTSISGGSAFGGTARGATDEALPGVGFTRLDGSLGGPLPGLAGATWVLAGTLMGQREHFTGLGHEDVPQYVPVGVDTVVGGVAIPAYEDRRAFDWATDLRLLGKVAAPAGGGSLSITGVATELQQRFFPGNFILDSASYSGSRETARMVIVNWRKPLGGGAATLRLNASLGSFHAASGLLDPATELATREPSLGITLETLRFNGQDSIPNPVTENLVRNIRSNFGLRIPYYGREAEWSGFQQSRSNPYGLQSFWPEGGLIGGLTLVAEERSRASAAVDWSAGVHTATVGLDLDRADVASYSIGSLLNMIGMNAFTGSPSRLGLFVANRLERGSLRAHASVRLDRHGSVGLFPNTPGRVFSTPAWSASAGTDDTAYTNSLARVFTSGRVQTGMSFNVGVSVDVAAGTGVRASFGRWMEPPSLNVQLMNTNADASFTFLSTPFGRDVDYEHASLGEVGISHRFTSRLSADVAVYRKTRPQYVFRIRPFADPLNPGDTINASALTTMEAAEDIGAEAALAWAAGDAISLVGAVSLRRTDLHTMVPFPAQPSGTFTQHSLVAALVIQPPWGVLAGLEASAFLRLTSGVVYTPASNTGLGLVVDPDTDQPVGARQERLPWTKRLDVRISKTLRTGAAEWSVFAEARNLFAWRNYVSLFSETGAVTNDRYRDNLLATEFDRLRIEASANGALDAANTITLPSDCSSWAGPVQGTNCESLRRVEQRFGNGDGLYTAAEQTAAFHAFYDAFEGPTQFYGAGRTIRLGMQVRW